LLYQKAEKQAVTALKKGFTCQELKFAAIPGGPSIQLVKDNGLSLFQSNTKGGLGKNSDSKNLRNSLGGKPKQDLSNRYKTPQIKNIDQLFELELGKLLQDKCNSITVWVNNKPVKAYKLNKSFGEYFKKGDIYYLDTMHGYHLEVFTANGYAKGVINLDGSWNYAKSKAAEGRRIRV
jgi:hypothetical protein